MSDNLPAQNFLEKPLHRKGVRPISKQIRHNNYYYLLFSVKHLSVIHLLFALRLMVRTVHVFTISGDIAPPDRFFSAPSKSHSPFKF